MGNVRKAAADDAVRIAEIIIFNYRLNFYPIFRSDEYYFGELRTDLYAQELRSDTERLSQTYVYDDGAVKGFVELRGSAVERLFVEPVLQGGGIGAELLEYAVRECGARTLWVLEKNERAARFYERNGFAFTGDKKYEEDTEEYLLKMRLEKGV